jgi:hypothetical protein
VIRVTRERRGGVQTRRREPTLKGDEFMSVGREDQEFMRLGVQYYVAARSAAWAELLPVCGNLYHHALEMLLKAGLSRKHSSRILQKKFSHKLLTIWNAFKAEFPSPDLPQFDQTIADIDEFEEIRYPDKIVKHGAQMLIDWASDHAQTSLASSPPVYQLKVNDLDRLVVGIFHASSRNPLFFTSGLRLRQDVQAMIARDNPVAEQILGKLEGQAGS